MSGLAKPRRVREDGLEYGLEVSWRTADDAKDLRARCLLLQRLVQLAGEQRILFFEIGNRSPGLASCPSRVPAQPLYPSARLGLPAGWSTGRHLNPPNGLATGVILAQGRKASPP